MHAHCLLFFFWPFSSLKWLNTANRWWLCSFQLLYIKKTGKTLRSFSQKLWKSEITNIYFNNSKLCYIFTLHCSTEVAQTTFIHQPWSQTIWSRILFGFITVRYREGSLTDLVAENRTHCLMKEFHNEHVCWHFQIISAFVSLCHQSLCASTSIHHKHIPHGSGDVNK